MEKIESKETANHGKLWNLIITIHVVCHQFPIPPLIAVPGGAPDHEQLLGI